MLKQKCAQLSKEHLPIGVTSIDEKDQPDDARGYKEAANNSKACPSIYGFVHHEVKHCFTRDSGKSLQPKLS